MRRRSFFLKLLLGNLLLTVVIIVLGGAISNRYLNASYRRYQRETQLQIAYLMQAQFEELWSRFYEDPEDLDVHLKRSIHPTVEPLRLTVMAADGEVLGDSSSMPAEDMQLHRTPDRPEMLAAMEGNVGWDQRSSKTLRTRFQYVALPIRHEDRIVAVVRVAMPVRDMAASGAFISQALLTAAAAVVLVSIVLALLISWIWYAPLRQLALASRALAAGKLDKKVRVSGSAELDALADAMNEMRGNLSRQMDLIARQQANLRTALANLQEAVVTTDSEDRVVLANETAIQLFTTEGDDQEPRGKHIQTFIRIPQLIELHETARDAQATRNGRFRVRLDGAERILDARVAPITGGSGQAGYLLVARDVTNMARVAAIRAEFVTNASHELRTPVATLRAAVDSLRDQDDVDLPTLRRIGDILDRQVSQMEYLIAGLLDLQALERSRRPHRVHAIGLGELADWIKEMFAEPAEQRGIELNIELPGEDVQLQSDRNLAELILRNLVDNAVKFTPAGGRVDCRFQPEGDAVAITVSDTGVGIPPEGQDRVFERFYQIDASRTGDARLRGTGLGLAIVKHAAERLGATLSLQSQTNVGTSITVHIPGRVRGETAAEGDTPGDEAHS
jgi:two-component system phosphate regulon sensor histidine kinase PhoR